ncbi:DUF4238 domain-containing protein [Cupriavidus sp. RAF12]|uniref:DUF4238 domain-containing protein n=1 Tax=Cupriavidus sp. RAF12 TaxID=3233050 RepID=UPI003F911B23
MSTLQQSHRHHYVPQWYQRGFLGDGQTAFKVLDLKPPVFRDKAGNVRGTGPSILTKGPAALFWEPDLYATRFMGVENDDIERWLFGAIDKSGQTAINAWLNEDYDNVHQTYWHMYEFMDALRLRTPRGLRFVSSMGKARDRNSVLMLMQQLRRMHCIMWAEGTLEIVNASQSATKFIFSDHPVTLYNSHVFPQDPAIPSGYDPHLHWLGTQTLFPFDKERLYVLTHVEFAHSPGPAKARKERTNARYFDEANPMVRYDDCIRGRCLTEKQVLEVNYIIKSGAERYIAGRSEHDLYPERHLKTTQWNKIGKFLLPSKDKVLRQSGYTVMKTTSGRYHFQDQFGRRPGSKAEFAREVQKAEEMEAHFKRVLAKHLAENKGADEELVD